MRLRYSHLLAILVTSVSYLAGQTPALSTPQVQAALQQLESSDWNARSAGFYDLIKLGTASDKGSKFPVADGILAFAHKDKESRPALIKALIKLLGVENELISSGSAPESEDYSVYYGDVIQAVSTLRDPSSLPVLLAAINTGEMAVSAVATFGDAALQSAVDKLPVGDAETRHSIFRVLTEMTEMRNMAHLQNKESIGVLSSTLIVGASDSNPRTRQIITEGLARIGTVDAVAALRQLASHDPFLVSGSGAVRYPVRDAAVKALKTAPLIQ